MKYHRTQIVVTDPRTGRDILFDSEQESLYFLKLLEMAKNGLISQIECHPSFVLQKPFVYLARKSTELSILLTFFTSMNARNATSPSRSKASLLPTSSCA